jgi:hypothetical protein
MKIRNFIFGLALLCVRNLFGQDIDIDMIYELPADIQSNIVLIVTNTQPCPYTYTNVISNTNLFSADEQELLGSIPLKYKNVTISIGPSGSVLTNLESNGAGWMSVAYFQYTNSNATDKITFHSGKVIEAIFRTALGEGYDVNVNGDSIENFLQLKGNVPNGLYLNFKGNHCVSWMHIVNGLAVGKWFEWNDVGNLKLEAEFKKPSNFIEQFRFNPPR